MWLCDLEMALEDIKENCKNYVFDKITPYCGGIIFYTSHHTMVIWKRETRTFEER